MKAILKSLLLLNTLVFITAFLTTHVLIGLKRHQLERLESQSIEQMQSALKMEHEIVKEAVEVSYAYLIALLGVTFCNGALMCWVLRKSNKRVSS